MTIQSAITALGPVLYWLLDDPTGPAAVDASGNAHTGVYGGPFTLRQYGPEAGTYAVQFAASGSVTCTGMPQIASAPFSVLWFESAYTALGAVGTYTMQNTPGALNRGWGVSLNASYTHVGNVWSTTGVRTPGASATPGIWDRWWHAYLYQWDGTQFSTSCDSYTPPATTGTNWSGNLSTHIFGYTAVYAAVIAHVAYFDKILTATQFNTISAFIPQWPFAPPITTSWPLTTPGGGGSALSPADPVVVDINQDLSDIRSAVRRDYSP